MYFQGEASTELRLPLTPSSREVNNYPALKREEKEEEGMECQQQEIDGDSPGLQLGESLVTESLEATILWKETRADLRMRNRPVTSRNMLTVQTGCPPQLRTPM